MSNSGQKEKNLNFYFHSSSWCRKMFYEGLKGQHSNYIKTKQIVSHCVKSVQIRSFSGPYFSHFSRSVTVTTSIMRSGKVILFSYLMIHILWYISHILCLHDTLHLFRQKENVCWFLRLPPIQTMIHGLC